MHSCSVSRGPAGPPSQPRRRSPEPGREPGVAHASASNTPSSTPLPPHPGSGRVTNSRSSPPLILCGPSWLPFSVFLSGSLVRSKVCVLSSACSPASWVGHCFYAGSRKSQHPEGPGWTTSGGWAALSSPSSEVILGTERSPPSLCFLPPPTLPSKPLPVSGRSLGSFWEEAHAQGRQACPSALSLTLNC